MNVLTDGVVLPADAATMAALLCVDPSGLGGAVLRGGDGPLRGAWLRQLAALLPAGAPLRRIPLHIQDDRLLGALDLAATLGAGRPVVQQGVLAESDGGMVVLSMAERIEKRTAAHIGAVLDTQRLLVERDGTSTRKCVRIGVIALDEGRQDDESTPPALIDRLAGRIEMQAGLPGGSEREGEAWTRADVAAARALLPRVRADDASCEVLCAAALALGIDSLRAPVLALRAACAHAALQGRVALEQADAVLAARLVLLPRARTLPATEPVPPDTAPPSDETPADTPAHAHGNEEAMEDAVVEAAAAVLPPGLLQMLAANGQAPARPRGESRSGIRTAGGARGRPAGVLRGSPRDGARLSLMETLRAAAPWQSLRKPSAPAQHSAGAVLVRREDLRIKRFKQRSSTTTLFVVDASGSTALHRLGEAKGAVELLLADCYVRRDHVALIAFRGRRAEVLLPPTRSLARARRCLSALAGGGGTPLAAAIEASLALADATRRRGCTPLCVMLTDGCANVALDGSPGRQDAGADALRMARQVRTAGVMALVLDTSAHPREAARDLAAEMGARYLPLPHADAVKLSGAVRAAAGSAS